MGEDLNPNETMMLAYYENKRAALEEQVKAGTLNVEEATNGKLYVLPLSTGEDVPVAFSDSKMVIQSGDLVVFNRDNKEIRLTVGEMRSDGTQIDFHSPRPPEFSFIRIHDAVRNLSAGMRAELAVVAPGK